MLNKDDFSIVKDEFGWKLINQHKLKEGLKDIDKNDMFAYKRVWRSAHTHLKSRRMACIMMDNLIKNKLPKTRSIRLLKSHIRIAEDEKLISEIQQLILTKQKKCRQEYLNERREQSYYNVR